VYNGNRDKEGDHHHYKEGLENEIHADTKWCFPKVLTAINKQTKDTAGAG
jgi:hypothetical protein